MAPDSDNLGAFLAHRAVVAAALDRTGDARDDLQRALEVAAEDYGDDFVDYVRSRLDALDAAGPDTRHHRLTAFPTVVQKWNYCGPAVIELCLRYLGIEMTQDLVAEAVKQEEGTPMLSIVGFLREQGMEVRRVEATPERVKAAIDAGIPIILEDDYSNTLHVSVAIGYDDRLGMLVVADPMTHAPRHQGIEARRNLASQQSYSAVAVLGRASDVTDELRRALDEAGLVESAPIALLDEASKTHPDALPALADVGPLEVAGLASEALAAKPSLARAAVMRTQALMQARRYQPHELAATVARYRTDFPLVAEFAQAAAEASGRLGAPAHAIADHVLAATLDPADARPHLELALSLTDWGERALAYRHANLGYARAPANPHGTLTLARVVVDDLLARTHERGELGAMRPAFLSVREGEEESPIPLDDDTVRALATHVVAAVSDMAPDDPNAFMIQGDMAVIAGNVKAAVAWFDKTRHAAPDWPLASLRYVISLDAAGQPGSLDAARELAARGSLPNEMWNVLIAHVGRIGDGETALGVLGEALDAGVERWGAVRAVYSALERSSGSQADAARALVALARSRVTDADLLYAVVEVLAQHMTSGHAVELLRERVDAAPDDARARVELAQLIGDTPEFRQEAVSLLEQARRLAPWADVLTLALGWRLLDVDPHRALELGEAVLEHNFTSFELRRRALRGLGRIQQAEELEGALAAFAGSLERADVFAILDHVGASRHGHAARLAVVTEPYWLDADDVRDWLWASFYGRARRDFSKLVAEHPEIIANPGVAEAVAHTGASIGAELYARACRRAAQFKADASEALRLEILARTTLGEFEGIGETVGDDVLGLVTLAENMPDPRERLQFAERALAVAPGDRRVLAAAHSALQDAGERERAIDAARQLLADYPFDHQGAERVAEVEAHWGDVEEAVRWATVAVSEAPYCTHALSVHALAAALAGDWDGAARTVDEYALRSRSSPEDTLTSTATILGAAAARDRSAFDASVAAARAATPLAPMERLIAACEARFGSE
jgi:tetratricopeptide (TPR) repeat protein